MTVLDNQLLSDAIREGRFDTEDGALPWFTAFDGAVRADWADRRNKPKSRSYMVWDDDVLRDDHTAYLLGRAARGGRVTRRLVASLNDEQAEQLAAVLDSRSYELAG